MSRNTSEHPTVGIVIVNWNNYEDTSKCLDSLSQISYPKIKTVVVDNGSTDGSAGKIESEYDCYLVRNNENLGFAAANNRGIDFILEEGADHVLLMNNDMVASETFLNPLVSIAESKADIAGVGCLVLHQDSEEVWSAGGKHIPYLAKVHNIESPVSDDPYETNFVSPALLLLTEQFLKEGYRLDDTYFFSVEDQQLAFDAQQDGWRFIVNPQSVVYHKGGGTAGSENPFRYYHYTWGRLVFASENLSFLALLIFSLFFVSSRLVRFCQWFIRGQAELIRATLLAVYDYVLGNDLKMPNDLGYSD